MDLAVWWGIGWGLAILAVVILAILLGTDP